MKHQHEQNNTQLKQKQNAFKQNTNPSSQCTTSFLIVFHLKTSNKKPGFPTNSVA